MLHDDNAVTKLAAAVSRIGAHEFPVVVTDTVRRFLEERRQAHRTAHRPGRPGACDAAARRRRARMIGATMRNTANPTMLSAGYKANVIPSSAEATIDARFLPGLEEELLADASTNSSVRGSSGRPWSATSRSKPVRRRLVDAMAAASRSRGRPGHGPIPYLMSGGTDAKSFSTLGIRCFGFVPLRLPPDLDFVGLFHGIDERVPVDGLRFGVRVLDRFLSRTAEPLFVAARLAGVSIRGRGGVVAHGQGGPAGRAARPTLDPDEIGGGRLVALRCSSRSVRSASAGRRCGHIARPGRRCLLTIAEVESTLTRIGADHRRRLARPCERRCCPGCWRRDRAASRRSCGDCSAVSCARARSGSLLDAVAQAAEVPIADGAPRGNASAATRPTSPGWPSRAVRAVAGFRLQVGRAVGPMLAKPADLGRRSAGPARVGAGWEQKLDGARMQIHRSWGGRVDLHPHAGRCHGTTT